MRLNQYLAHATGLSRRRADQLIAAGQVTVDDRPAQIGQQVGAGQRVNLDGQEVQAQDYQTIMLHKPAGYITSRQQQGAAPTIYQLLPPELHQLKPIGRLDKDSSGLLLLTSDGQLAQRLGHPSAGKWKRYHITVDRALSETELAALRQGVKLDDGLSRLDITPTGKGYEVRLQEGRNRQIRRSLAAVGRRVLLLHRYQVGELELGRLAPGAWRELPATELPK
jgi:23S rRNA pseudouridine2605 synthase